MQYLHLYSCYFYFLFRTQNVTRRLITGIIAMVYASLWTKCSHLSQWISPLFARLSSFQNLSVYDISCDSPIFLKTRPPRLTQLPSPIIFQINYGTLFLGNSLHRRWCYVLYANDRGLTTIFFIS